MRAGLSFFIPCLVSSLLIFSPCSVSAEQEVNRVMAEGTPSFDPVSVEFFLFREGAQPAQVVKKGVLLQGKKSGRWLAATHFSNLEWNGAIGYVALFSNGRTLYQSSPYVPIKRERSRALFDVEPSSVQAEIVSERERLASEKAELKRLETQLGMLQKDVDLLSSAEERERLEYRVERQQERLLLLEKQRRLLENTLAALKREMNPRRFLSRRSSLLEELRKISTMR